MKEAKPESRRDRYWIVCLILLAGFFGWLALPTILDGGTLQRAREAAARNTIEQLSMAIKAYELDFAAYPQGDGSGTAALMKALHTRKQPCYWLTPPDDLLQGNVRSPIDSEKIIYYRCPGVRNPKSFDLWCEDARGRADGINNWK